MEREAWQAPALREPTSPTTEHVAESPELSLIDTVAGAVRACLPDGSLATVVDKLNVKRRQLQRWLAEEGTTFKAIRDDVREQMAKELLAGGVPLPTVAAKLGYADVTGLHRAFRRWTASTPGQYRDSAAKDLAS